MECTWNDFCSESAWDGVNFHYSSLVSAVFWLTTKTWVLISHQWFGYCIALLAQHQVCLSHSPFGIRQELRWGHHQNLWPKHILYYIISCLTIKAGRWKEYSKYKSICFLKQALWVSCFPKYSWTSLADGKQRLIVFSLFIHMAPLLLPSSPILFPHHSFSFHIRQQSVGV